MCSLNTSSRPGPHLSHTIYILYSLPLPKSAFSFGSLMLSRFLLFFLIRMRYQNHTHTFTDSGYILRQHYNNSHIVLYILQQQRAITQFITPRRRRGAVVSEFMEFRFLHGKKKHSCRRGVHSHFVSSCIRCGCSSCLLYIHPSCADALRIISQ